MAATQAPRTSGPLIFADADEQYVPATAPAVRFGVARCSLPPALLPNAGAARPSTVLAEEGTARRGGWVDAAKTGRVWAALIRARAEYDPEVLSAAESAVALLYLPLAHELARSCSPGALCCMRASERALVKAVRNWSRDGGSWGFEEYARGAIEAEIRGNHDAHMIAELPAPRSGSVENLPASVPLVSPRA
ncbi:MAG: hypothetical protein ABI382_11610 [Nakamurella sp.]